ncbi:head-tail adaptor protein [Paracoccus suum]|uniref:Head-tail adaptor protein n=1 Tax=Paracoccus suum TaxID=2259340 RepID=A0A344PL95_9RHOB|nr:head-tail adaptor protein [Paracoccus suum]AXC50150.1 head-tail adaptor protein [Paracoccus suum]
MSGPDPRHRLILEAPERASDGMGGQTTVWRALGAIWAGMRASTGREARGEVGAVSVVSWAITTRAAPAGDPRRPRPGQRLRMGERLFRIEAIAETDAGGRWLTCHAREEGGA